MHFAVRLATLDDLEQIEALMKRSMNILGIGHYSEEQIQGCCQFVCVPDQQLIDDKTYFVAATHTGELVGCGGWSFRNKRYAGPSDAPQIHDQLNPLTDPARIRAMFTDPNFHGKGIGSMILSYAEKAAKERGFSKGTLGATLSGLAFYLAKGWRTVSQEHPTLPNGTVIEVVQMEKNLQL